MTLPAFELCVAPYELQAFLGRWWGREPLFIKRDEPDRFARLINRSTFDDLVAHTNLRAPFFRLFKDGNLIPESACTVSRPLGPSTDPGLADLNAVYDGFSRGATIVLAALGKVDPALAQLCAGLEAAFQFPFEAEAYLAPPDAGALPAHHDPRDIFMLQAEGSRTWRIWNGSQVEDVLLEPGDSLYLPHDVLRAAEASPTSSLHLSVSTTLVRWLDVINAAVHDVLTSLKTDPDAQRALVFGRKPNQALAAEDDAALAALAARVIEGLDADRLTALAASFSEPPKRHDRSGALLRRLMNETAASGPQSPMGRT